MLKINLLPPYIYEGKTRKTWVAAWVVAVAAVVGGMLFWQSKLNAQVLEINSKKDAISAKATEADNLKTQADKINAESAGIRAKNDFVKGAIAHNTTAYPTVYNNVAEYTLNRVVLSAVSPNQGQV